MSELTRNPFKAIDGWYWIDETGDTYGPYPSQRTALRGLLDYWDYLEEGPTLWQRLSWPFRAWWAAYK